MPDLKDRQGRVIGKLKLDIKANANSLKENQNLVQRSIVPSFKNNHFSIFMVNIASLSNKIIDLKNDVYAQLQSILLLLLTLFVVLSFLVIFNRVTSVMSLLSLFPRPFSPSSLD